MNPLSGVMRWEVSIFDGQWTLGLILIDRCLGSISFTGLNSNMSMYKRIKTSNNMQLL